MGRFNVNQIMYMIRKNLKGMKWLVPKKYRKYVYFFVGVFGLIAYFNFMLFMTNSQYLLAIKNIIIVYKDFLFTNYNHSLVIGVLVIGVFLLLVSYFRNPEFEEKDGKKQSNGSIYYQVNAIISISYVGVTILGFLPILI